MLILRWLCRLFPAGRFLFVGIGYVLLVIGGGVWFICFPLTAYTLRVARQFPLPYFGVPSPLHVAYEIILPEDMVPLFIPICLAFTLFGMVTIYFNVRALRRLRLGQLN